MLQLVLGTSGHGKTEFIHNKLKEELLKSREDVYLIVPDQLTFSRERSFLESLGAKLASKIKIWSFSKLCEEVFRLYGGIFEKPLTETGKYVFLLKALKIARDDLKIYSKTNDNILKLLLEAINEFKENLISPQSLKETAADLSGNLKDKINDISLILSIYNALIENDYLDESDVLTRALKVLEGKIFLKGAVIAFDGFESFNKQKLMIIREAMKRAEICYISLCTDTLAVNDTSLFEPIAETAYRIKSIAAEERVKENVPVFFKESKRHINDELRHLENNLFRSKLVPYIKETDKINIFEAKTVYDEAEFIAASIRELVIKDNYRYGDIAVVSKEPGKYYSILAPVFEKWEIPCYFEEPIRLDSRPIIRLVMSSFRLSFRGFRAEEILLLLKTGLTEFNSDDISLFENYIYLWKIDGKAFESEFYKHPKGFGYEKDEESDAVLEKLNFIRSSIVTPVLKFKESIKSAKAGEIGEAIYNLLTELKADIAVSDSFNKYIEMGMPELAKENSASWQKLMDILDEFTYAFGQEQISGEDYFSVLRDVVSKAETRDIPMRMDTVTLASTDIYKPQSEKAVFIMGASQGEVPFVPSESGIFSDSERSRLISFNLNMDSKLEDKIKSERFLTYAAAVSAKERLFVSYHKEGGEEELTPGRLITDLKKIFPLLKTNNNQDVLFYAGTYNSAFGLYASLYKEESAEKESLKALLIENEEYKAKINALDIVGSRTEHRISDKYLAETMFAESYFSASQVESYHRCAFSYFCKYGLNAKEKRTAEIDNLEYGTVMHYLFEAILKSDFSKYMDNRELLLKDVNALIDKYTLEKMGGINSLSGKDKYRFSRLVKAAVSMIERFIEEFTVSRFKPEYFEFYLSDYSEFPPLKIYLDNGKAVTVGGIADRIDVYTNEKGKFVRVVDYKTGAKEFKYTDVLFGLNLQMLIYLAAMAEKGNVIPSGILYLPSSVPEISGDKNLSAAKASAEMDKRLSASGVILDDIEIINAMEKDGAGRFLPTAIKDNGKLTKPQSVLSDKGFEALFTHIKSLIKTMAENLIEGDISAKPLMVNNNSCTYCPYKSVCGNVHDDRLINKMKLTKEELIEEIERREKNA